ncbi:MAG: ABC transporter permease [Christensenellales bacterium]|jgi:ABC-2 type transport system permease protein
MKHWTKVFQFTFAREARSRGYILMTLIVALIALIAIPTIMILVDSTNDDAVAATSITTAVSAGATDLSALAQIDAGIYKDVAYAHAADVDAAEAMISGDAHAVILAQSDGAIQVLLPAHTSITETDAAAFGAFVAAQYPYLTSSADLETPAYAASALHAAPENGADSARTALGIALPYATLMLLYFMILIYGNGVASSVITEKTSKLMDQFLVSIRPSAMIFGKTLAIALTGIMQFCIWIASIVGGFALGAYLVRALNPDTTLGILDLFAMLGSFSGIFTPGAVILAILIVAAGFLLYCALAGIGGAMAEKPEDLSTTNVMFTLAIIVSFFACIMTGDSAGMVSDAPILAYVPFTGILVSPGRVLLGEMTLAQSALSLGIIALTAVLLVLLAGKVYTMMAFYRGNPPTPARMLKMLRAGARNSR